MHCILKACAQPSFRRSCPQRKQGVCAKRGICQLWAGACHLPPVARSKSGPGGSLSIVSIVQCLVSPTLPSYPFRVVSAESDRTSVAALFGCSLVILYVSRPISACASSLLDARRKFTLRCLGCWMGYSDIA